MIRSFILEVVFSPGFCSFVETAIICIRENEKQIHSCLNAYKGMTTLNWFRYLRVFTFQLKHVQGMPLLWRNEAVLSIYVLKLQ